MPSIHRIRRRARARRIIWSTIFAGMACLAAFKLPSKLRAQATTPPTVTPLGSLKGISTPRPTNLEAFLKTDRFGNVTPQAKAAAIALGKALFWDQAGGSDGQACASCHFNAGADSRTRNQINPGFRSIPSQTVFGAMPPQQTTGTTPAFTADYHLRASDFPFTKFNDQTDRNSGIISDTQAIASSQGVFNSDFRDITPT